MVMDAVHLPATERRELLQLIRSLPQEERRSAFAPKRLAPLADGPGGWVIRTLQYRNLNWLGIAMTLAIVTPTYLSAATYGVIGSGRMELTPRLVTDFAALLGIDAREPAALTGVALREAPPPPAPETVDAAALLWEGWFALPIPTADLFLCLLRNNHGVGLLADCVLGVVLAARTRTRLPQTATA
jgi:hypothetical protein